MEPDLEPEEPKKSETIEVRVPWRLKQDFMARARREGRSASEVVRDLMQDYVRRPAQRTPQQTLETAMTAIRRHPRTGFAAVLGAAGISALIAGGLPAGAAPDFRPAFEGLDRNGDDVIDAAEYGQTGLVVKADALEIFGRGSDSWAIYAGEPTVVAVADPGLSSGGESAANPLAPFDQDGDGRVSLSEWEARFSEATERAFRRLDVDDDGMLDPQGLILDILDHNGDGRISRREFSTALVVDRF
jgi:hypothetical protein